MTWATALSADEEERLRPLYSRVLRLRHVDPGGVLCFVYFEGMVSLGVLLALAELVSWWGVFLLPIAVAAMVKANDLVAAAVARTSARVPAQERERFRLELRPAVGRARVPGMSPAGWGPDPGSSTNALAGAVPGAATARALRATALRATAASATARASSATAAAATARASGAVRAFGVRGIGGRLVARLVPAGRPLSMTSMVRARLESGARHRLETDWEPRPDRDVMARLRAGVPGLSPLTVTQAAGVTPLAGRPGAAAHNTPDRIGADRMREDRIGADRMEEDRIGGDAPAGRETLPLWSRSVDPPSAVPGSSAGRRRNDRVVERPTRRWLVRLDPMDGTRHWARQSARRRYE